MKPQSHMKCTYLYLPAKQAKEARLLTRDYWLTKGISPPTDPGDPQQCMEHDRLCFQGHLVSGIFYPEPMPPQLRTADNYGHLRQGPEASRSTACSRPSGLALHKVDTTS